MMGARGHLQELEADLANREGFSRHHRTRPLYTMADAEASVKHLSRHAFKDTVDVGAGVKGTFFEAGHILGAVCILLDTGRNRIVFSGDLGRYNIRLADL